MSEYKTKAARLAAAMIILIAIAAADMDRGIEIAAGIAAYLIAGYDIISEALENIREGHIFDENFLMAVASIGALAMGKAVEACAVVILYQIGEMLQDAAVDKSRDSINELMDIRPDTANVESEQGRWKPVPAEEVAEGTIILVKPGERVPIDGIVETGDSDLDTSALTGESLPRDVAAGDAVASGCLNISGALTIKTTATFGGSTASKILELVENAGERKAESEKFITKFARYYTPAVCAGAAALALLPPVIRMAAMGAAPMWTVWIYRALTFLVISCPCALVISIPLSFFGGIGGAGRQGILIKGANFMETLSKVKTVAFDKTGTVTEGSFNVAEVEAAQGYAPDDILEYAAKAESFSSHPIAESLKRAYGKEIDQSEVTDIEERGGYGVTGKVGGRRAACGSAKLMETLGLSVPDSVSPRTSVYVAIDGRYAGRIIIADRIKQGAAEAMRGLRKAGVSKLVMLTGDSRGAAEEAASELGISDVRAELLPGEKVDSVEALLQSAKEGEKIAFVGDGINDAPVLARADIGIAMGALGSDAAIEAADIVLMDDDPAKVAKAIFIARRCLRIVKQNIVFSLGVKAICLALGAVGIAGMWMAIFADTGVMIIAVLNAGRALMVKNIREGER